MPAKKDGRRLFTGMGLIAVIAGSAACGQPGPADQPSGASMGDVVAAIDSLSAQDWSISDADALVQRVVARSSAAGLQQLADDGDPRAEVLAGIGLLKGISGFRRDPSRAVAQFRDSAGQNFASGQVMLGFAYENGLGGAPHDVQEAVRYYRLAADQGDAGGQESLADMVMAGLGGLKPDRAEALRLYRLSARQGDVHARDTLRRLDESW